MTGACQNSECIPGYMIYAGSLSCQGVESVSSSKINPNTTSDVNCVTQIFRSSAEVLTLNLSREPDQVVNHKIQFVNRTMMGDTEVWRFTANDVKDGDELFCLLLRGDDISANLSSTIIEYDLPSLRSPPTLRAATATSISIRWRSWDPDRDYGDPPVVAYIPYYRKAVSEEWISGTAVSPGEGTLEFMADNLEAETEYSFSVSVVREGVNGEGPRGPSANFRTNCDVSDVTPQNVMAYFNETSKQVNISWQIPDNMCSSGISSFSIYYKIEGSNQEPQFLANSEPDVTWITVNTPVSGEEKFSFFVTLTIDEESALSEESNQLMIKIGDSPGLPIIIIIIAIVVVVVIFIILVFVLLRVWKKKDDVENVASYTKHNGGYEADAVTLGMDGNDCNSPPNGSGKSKPSEEPPVVINLGEEAESEDEMEEDEEEETHAEDPDIVYGNLQKPQKVKVTDLRNYINMNLQEGRLEQEFSLLKAGKQFPWTVAEKKENKKKNRFRNMFTYDHSRVVLEVLPNDEHSDYYNASYIMNQKGKKAFIAAQGPNTASLNDFWRMAWSEEVSTIVMVTNVIEKGKDRCLQYWPDEVGSMKAFGDIKVVLEECTGFADYIIRKLNVIQLNGARVIHQLHYVSWPDMGTPKQPTPLIAFVKQAKLIHREKKTPMVVHCSAGVGRTGTFIALYSLLDNVLNDEYVHVFDFVKKMRENRVNMVQTGKQYVFLYRCLMEASLTNDTEMTRDDISKLAVDLDQSRPKKEFQLLKQFEEDDEAYQNYLRAAGCKRPFSMSEKCYNLSMLITANLLKVPYWPTSDFIKHGKYSVSCKGTETELAFILRQLEVSQDESKDVLSVNHLQLTSWPARNNLSGLDSIIRKVTSLQTCQMVDGPVIVHCVDGEGLSGIFVAVSSEIERLQLTGKMDMFKTVRQLRETNTDVLALEEDYIVCYKLLLQYLQGLHTYQNM
ncbi:Receptor-type tyrosine-protein phosphatase T [Holothuria leucospilota]|uniref:protein-tyrosine-phosphatase n=1 Tax=Holothuria leucospilota TaxID=206669 RepID=A0A9Q1HCR7_HOLLE|nr:Receptor-type tyrosine-protein phosphatase T [Holothuria leucospilota]